MVYKVIQFFNREVRNSNLMILIQFSAAADACDGDPLFT